MTELIDWLRAQLDEDERKARDVPSDRSGPWWVEPRPKKPVWGELPKCLVYAPGGPVAEMWEEATLAAEFIADHDPDRMLREVRAKRELMDLAEMLLTAGLDDGWDVYRALALPFSDRDGYRSEWAVATEVPRG